MLNETIFTVRQIQKRFTAIFFLIAFVTFLVGLLFNNKVILIVAITLGIYSYFVYNRYKKYLKYLYVLEDVDFSVLKIKEEKTLFIKYNNFDAPINYILLEKNVSADLTIRTYNGIKVSTSFTPKNDSYDVAVVNGEIIIK